MGRDTTALLPNGEMFGFWERENHYDRILYVDGKAVGEGYTQDAEEGSGAGPGTCVRIHAGVYRECVSPGQGGADAEHMICYEAFGDGEVCVKASEVITDFRESVGWRSVQSPMGRPDSTVGSGSTGSIRRCFRAITRSVQSISCMTGCLSNMIRRI